MTNLGTRIKATAQNNYLGRESETHSHTRDVGMRKRITASFTFNAGTGRISAVNGTFTNTFAVGDPVLVAGTNLNNGFFEVAALDTVNAGFLQLIPPPKDEGPISCIIRTP